MTIYLRNLGTVPACDVGTSVSPTTALGNAVLLPSVEEVLPRAAHRVGVAGHDRPGAWVQLRWRLTIDLTETDQET